MENKWSRDLAAVERLRDHLLAYRMGRGVPHFLNLQVAAIVPGWIIFKETDPKTSKTIYTVSTPNDLDPLGNWGNVKEKTTGDRAWLVEFLRKNWLGYAKRWIEKMREM
jgi:hypothetical protein